MDLSNDFIDAFSREWLSSWNAHDIDRILEHYSDDFVIESPLAAKRFPDSGGRVKGKDAVKAYWSIGLSSNTNLHFTLKKVFKGVDSISILYNSNAEGKDVIETMFFDNDMKVDRAFVFYS